MRWLALVALVGCYHPTPPEGAACAANEDCPSPLHCYNGICLSHPPDSGASDAISIDGPPDADLACTCSSASTLSCAGVTMTCPAGCATSNGISRCRQVVPSNSVTALFPSGGQTTIDTLTTFDTDTGAITGGITRTAGEGIDAGIGFQKQGGAAAPLGVFSFVKLTVGTGGVVHFTGTRAAVFVVEGIATIDGQIDGSGSCYGTMPQCAGPGGGAGGSFTVAAGGCAPGAIGIHDSATGADSGGGGGGGGAAGASGGTETASGIMFQGGAGGAACMPTTLEPLVGGSGGGAGGPGDSPTSNYGGGGGGALQLTAFDTIRISGTLDFGGAGGMAGTTNVNNGGAGCGGGAGGAILLEAPKVIVNAGILAANGGGGGGGSDHLTAAAAGLNGRASSTPALGGTGVNGGGNGGNGGAGILPATPGGNSSAVNSGGGGGAVGVIYIRSLTVQISGTISPMPGQGPLRTQ